ncbi:uncharacterized protein N7459_006054 [Penicillium hispanicum]|uniref:uncharacterized protein n=1 Tax=Penicillium hispanicum TaxID=1080232 RepID=UPI0025402349|nr:uncharacterized protein N7459_006054 [Penicillium hispanicum]KAJ5580069.1 hypothetical protein N7459_006054 [Penicillium hispanicum]
MPENEFVYEQRRLENDRVAIEPFDTSLHAAKFMAAKQAHPELFDYVMFPEIETAEEFVRDFYDKHIGPDPSACLYAVIDKTTAAGEHDPTANYAGTVALTATNASNASTEIGVMIFPGFQRTHVASNAIGLLLLYTLDPPSLGGLGLRRVQWQCHMGNQSSRKVAERMGFELEGILRWDKTMPGTMAGLPVEALEKRNGTSGEPRGRHTTMYSIVWDEWDEKRVKVVEQMARKK